LNCHDVSGLPIWDAEAASLVRQVAVENVCLAVNLCLPAKQESIEFSQNMFG
jgi:hypothetical protein